jgi:tetratricopeptide (TPR) repeat protein
LRARLPDSMLRLRTLVLLILAFLPLPGAFAQTGEDPIISALRNQQFDKARKLLRTALIQSPNDAQLWTMQGVANDGAGNKKEALISFRHALRLSPDNIPALQGAAQIEFDTQDPAGIPLLEHLISLHPDDLTSQGMLAILQYQQGDCASAVVHFEKAAPLFESKLPALQVYGSCLVKLKRFDQATDVFARALALDPGDRRGRQILAAVQLMAHQQDQAIVTLSPLLGSNADAPTLELSSTAYEDAHDTEKAVDAIRQAILIDPYNVNLYVDFAALSSSHQSFQVGINVVNDGIALQPKAAPLYFARGVLYVQLADYDMAQADFEKAYDLYPSQSLSIAAQGLAAVQQNDLGHALAGVQDKLTRKPNDPLLLYLEADILLQQGAEPGSPQFDTAMRSAKKAVELRPNLSPSRDVLAKLYLKTGQYTEAAAQCRKALEIDPKDQTAVYHLIQALRKTDEKSEITALLKQLALLRQQAALEEHEQYRYKLVEDISQSK